MEGSARREGVRRMVARVASTRHAQRSAAVYLSGLAGRADLDDVRSWLAAKIAQIRSGRWSPYEYPYWAIELEKAWPAVEPLLAESEDVQNLANELAIQIAKKRPQILGGLETPRRDSVLVSMRRAVEAPQSHWWFWPELIETP